MESKLSYLNTEFKNKINQDKQNDQKNNVILSKSLDFENTSKD